MLSIAKALQPLLALAVLTPSLHSQSTVVISQVYGGGGNVDARLRNDFVELLNRGASTVDVSGWTVQYASAAGSSWAITRLNGTIAPGQYYLVQEAQGNAGTVSLPAADATGSIMMSATSGKVALVSGTTALTVANPSGSNILDFVGYGDASFSFGRPAGTLSNTTAAIRRDGGCLDSRNNSGDFVVGTPTPRNRQSSRNSCHAAPPPDTTIPTVEITRPLSNQVVAGNVTIAADASDNTAVTSVSFYVDGRAIALPVQSPPYRVDWDSASIENGSHVLTAVARDAAGNSATSRPITVRVQNTPPVQEETPRISMIVHGASFEDRPVSPGQVVTIFGSRLGPVNLVRSSANLSLPAPQLQIAGTRVLFDGNPAAILWTTSNAVSVIAPYSLGKTVTQIVVEYQGHASNSVSAGVEASALGVFSADASGRGQALVTNEDGSANSKITPAERGSVVSILCTGLGQLAGIATSGQIATELATFPSGVKLSIGGLDAEVIALEAVVGLAQGLFQIKAKVPVSVEGERVPLLAELDGKVTHPSLFLTVKADTPDAESAEERKFRELNSSDRVPELPDLANDRTGLPPQTLGLVSWNIQVGGTSVTSDTRPPMVRSALRDLFGGSYQLLAAQEIPNAASSTLLQELLPGGSVIWQSSFFDTDDSMDNGFYFRREVQLRDAFPLFISGKRAGSDVLLHDESLAEHPPQVAQFVSGKFDFTLITLHLTFADGETSESVRELRNILDYLDWYFEQPGHDPDVIVCGDFNVPSELSGQTGKADVTLDAAFATDSRFQTGERRFVVTVHQPTSRSPVANGGSPARNYDHCVLSADTMEEFVLARRVDTTILTGHPEDPEQRLTSDHFPIVAFFRTEGTGVYLDNRPTILRVQ